MPIMLQPAPRPRCAPARAFAPTRGVAAFLALALAFALLAASALLAGCVADEPLKSGESDLSAVGDALGDATASLSCPPSASAPRSSSSPSTLSADVDTASYCILRSLVADGYGPLDLPDGAVRTEELLNYFDYDYPAPEDDELFGVSVQMGPCPWYRERALLVMGFATEPDEYAASAGSNLVFLIDVSGSMDEPDKLPLLKDAFATLVAGLSERDRVSIVTYANDEHVVLEGAPGNEADRIMGVVDSLTASGATNGEAGLDRAYRVAEEHFIEGGTNRIILASDGGLNVGISSEDALHEYVDQKRKTGVYLSALGFGAASYRDAVMETLADHGNGAYHYIDCAEEAERVFGTNLCANLMPLADDVKVQVAFNPTQVKRYRLVGYENRALAAEEFRDDDADAGEVGSDHAFTVAYELQLTDAAFDMAEPWLTCTMRYRSAGDLDAGVREQQRTVDASSFAEQPNDDWTFAAAVIECGMKLNHEGFADDAPLEQARELLSTIELDEQRRGFDDLLATLVERDAARACAAPGAPRIADIAP